MAKSLDVYLNRSLVGILIQDNHGEMSFRYSEYWINNPNATALSCSLPLRPEPYSRKECVGFFGGILPEGDKRSIIARNLGISAKNDVAMLEQIGGECAGAVTFVPCGDNLPEQADRYRHLTKSELADVLRELPRRPLLAGSDDVRLSLAGAQDKLVVHVTGDQISVPLDGALSTHILKPGITPFSGIVFNELLCMRLAKAVGLPTASVELGSAEDIDYLLVERYDRIRVGTGNPERLHQEDFCQAFGIVSENKYQNEGGPSIAQCVQLLRKACSVPAIGVGCLVDSVIFNYLIGNNDAHGKNFSLLYTGNSARPVNISLAPLYDVVCTAYYPELSRKMAMKFWGEYDSARVQSRHFDRLAEETGTSTPILRRRAQHLAKAVVSSISSVMPDHRVAVGVADLIRGRCEHCLQILSE